MTGAIALPACASRAPDNAVQPAETPASVDLPDIPADTDVKATMTPSPLQQTLADATPARVQAPASMHKRLERAVDAYLQRIPSSRVYLRLDKPIYQPGETIWFRTWELGTSDLLPATRSGQGMMFSLISPKGAVVLQKRVAIVEGVARNDFRLPVGVPGGEYTIRAQSDTGARVERNVIVSSYQPPRVKKKLEFVRKAYGPGDTVSAALSLNRATGEPLASAKVTAIAVLDSAEIARVPVAMTTKGTALIKFVLPTAIDAGDGLLTVLVEDGGVVESTQKRIPITLDQIQFALFPEGGDLVAGLPARVYFQAKNTLGKPADVQGRIIDDTGAVVASFASFHNGLGRFELTPVKGRSYRAQITRPVGIARLFPVPEVKMSGCSMQSVDDFDSRRADMRVAVWCSDERAIIATATQRERRIATQSVTVPSGQSVVIALPAPRWDQGIVRVTLFSDRGAPLAERLIYRGHGATMKLDVTTDRSSYAPRDRVSMSIKAMDLAGKPVEADLAVAVVDDTVLGFADDKTAHLFTKMYLEHEMPDQEIEEPNFYFSDDAKAAPGLDLVLGTHGWRRFRWQLVLSPEHGAEWTGEHWSEDRGFHANKRSESRQPRTETVRQRPRTLRVLQRDGVPVAEPTENASKERFLIGQPAAQGSLEGTVIDQKGQPVAGVSVTAQSVVTYRSQSTVTGAGGRYAFRNLAPGRYTITFYFKTVSVRHDAAVRLGHATRLNARIDTSKAISIPKSASEVEYDMPEGIAEPVAATPAKAPPRVARRPVRARPPKKPEVMPAPPPPPPLNVKADQPDLGPRLAQQAKRQLGDKDWGEGNDKFDGRGGQVGWAPVREFPMPNYQPGYDGPRIDFRETIHWAPIVRTDKNGQAHVEFHVSDAVTSFRVTVEGVSRGGTLGRNETLVQSKLPISLAAKIPLEVSRGDRIRLPITLTNETTRTFTARMDAVFGPAFKVVGTVPATLSMAGGQRKSLLYTLDVVGDGRDSSDGRVALSVETANLKDEMEQVIDVVPLGFPQEVSLAGTVTDVARHEVSLKGALPGTIRASLTMYPSPLATMTKGTEAIIREPYGCFEQASSANYPNVMVLTYLQNHDAADPELVTRTHGLLERGYRKLTGYESPKRGYEWFGGDPGHEALTAYGLLEFIDMAKVYADTDRGMVRRTASWLASRQDGKGGYQRNERALDSFGRANAQVTNGYISWALSEMHASADRGGLEIDLANDLAYQRTMAENTKDPYLMALAVGVLVNLDPSGTATSAALSKLAGMRGSDGVYAGADHSITRSGGVALDIETTSLAVLALLGGDASYLSAVRPSIAWLDKQRSGFGGYGSTQSTVLALKAMTRYAEKSRATRSSGVASLWVGGKSVRSVPFQAGHKDALEFGDVSRYLRAGTNQIEVRLASKDPLPYSMAIEYRSKMPASSQHAKVALSTHLASDKVAWGEGVRMRVAVRNLTDEGVPMTLARVGLPGGLTFQTWQLKELRDKQLIDFYETRDREVILYFRSLDQRVVKELDLDLMATVPGTYVAPASSTYLYYTDEHKHWAEPVRISVSDR